MRKRYGAVAATVCMLAAGFVFVQKGFVATTTVLPTFTVIQDRFFWSRQHIEVLEPAGINVSHPIKLVIYFHHHGERANGPLADSLKRVLIESLLDAKYVIASSDAHNDAWGSPQSVKDYCDLYNYVAARYAVSDVYFISESMGGAPSLNLLVQHVIPNVRAWVGICPVCNVSSVENDPRFSPTIHEAYPNGIPSSSNPCLAPPEKFDIPMLAFATATDTTVPRAQNIDLLAKHVGREKIEIVNCIGDHGDSTQFQPDTILNFLGGH